MKIGVQPHSTFNDIEDGKANFPELLCLIISIYQNKFSDLLSPISFGSNQKSILGSINSFENSSQEHILILTGEAGSGKTRICQEYVKLFYQREKITLTNYLPVYISLLKFKNRPEGFLKRYFIEEFSFEEEYYQWLCEEGRLLLILDDYEVIEELDWLRNYLMTEKDRPSWERLKIIIVSREVHLSLKQNDYESAFYPIVDKQVMITWMSTTLRVGQLNEQDQQEIIKQYIDSKHDEKDCKNTDAWEYASYEFYRTRVPNIKKFFSNPQMLMVFLNYMPEEFEKRSEDSIAKKNVAALDIYEILLKKWIEQQVRKQWCFLSEIPVEDILLEIKLKSDIWEVCIRIAIAMAEYVPKKNELTLQEVERITRLGVSRESVERAIQMSPLRFNNEKKIGFINDSVRVILEKMPKEKRITYVGSESLFKGEVKLLSEFQDSDLIDSPYNKTELSDACVDNLAFQMREEGARAESRYKYFIRKTYEMKELSMLSVNSGTVLARGGIDLSGEEFIGVTLSAWDKIKRKQVGAKLTGGCFDSTDFTDSDLTRVNLEHAWLRNAVFRNCTLKEVNFGKLSFKHRNTVSDIEYRPDLNRLFTASENKVYSWDLETGQCLKVFEGHTRLVTSISIDRYGYKIASGSEDKSVRIWDLLTGVEEKIFNQDDQIRNVCMSEDSNSLAWIVGDHQIVYWDLLRGKAIFSQKEQGTLFSIYLSSLGKSLVWGVGHMEGCIVRKWNRVDGLKNFIGHEAMVTSISMSRNENLLVTGSIDRTLRIWSVDDQSEIAKEPHDGWISSVSLSEDCKYVATGSYDHVARVWDISNLPRLGLKFSCKHDGPVNCISLSKDGNKLAVGGNYNVRVWDVTNDQIRDKTAHKGYVVCDVSSDGTKIYSYGFMNGILKIWDLAASSNTEVQIEYHMVCTCHYLSADNNLLISGSLDGSVFIYDIVTNTYETVQYYKDISTTQVSLSYDGEAFAIRSTGDDSFCVVNRVKIEGAKMNLQPGSNKSSCSIYLGPRGDTVIFAELDNNISLRDRVNRNGGKFKGHSDTINDLKLTKDCKMIVSASHDKTVRVWDVKRVKEIALLEHDAPVLFVHLSEDKSTVISCCSDKKAYVWDVVQRKILAVIKHRTTIYSMSVNDQKGLFIIGSETGDLQVWRRQDALGLSWQLHWLSRSANPILNLADCDARGAKELSISNHRLLEQEEAIVDPLPEESFVDNHHLNTKKETIDHENEELVLK